MSRWRWGLILLPLVLFTSAWAEPVIRLVEFDRPITPVSSKRIIQSIDDAEKAGDALVLIELDTPGGEVSSTHDIVKRMLSAKIPVVVWVGPAGAHAASAGFFILVAADVAAMAPGTRTGAASTIYGMGQQSQDGDVLLKKANEDNAALLRSIAERRGRDVEACEEAVFSAKAFEQSVALEKGLADLEAGDRESLLELLQGREITRFDGSTVTLETAGATFVTSEFSLRHRFMEFLANPIVALLLFLIALGGLYIEFTQPGVVLPGVVGALALILFALTTQQLPISAIGILLILLGIVMFILEIKVTSYGMLSLGGTACLAIGGWMLVDGPIPELRVPPSVVLPSTFALALVCIVAVRLAVRAQSEKVGTGVEGMTLESGTVTETLDPRGRVKVRGEIWNASSLAGPIPRGTRVRVVRIDDMELTVEPVQRSEGV